MALPTDSKNLVTVERLSAVIGGTDGTGGLWGKTKALVAALDGTVSGSAGAGKTLTAFSQTDGKVSATFGNISITKSQVSDFPTSMTPTSHTHGNIQNGGTLNDTAAAAAGNDYVVIRDADNNKIQTSTIKGTDVADAVSKKHSHSTLTLSTTAQAYDGTHTLALPSSDPYSSARTPTSHATSATTYGVGTTANYGHVKLITGDLNGKSAADGIAAAQNHTHSQYAPVASPALSGTPTAPTADAGTNTTQIATTAFVKAEINAVLDAADAMQFKGTIGSSGATVTALPDTHEVGWTYKVATAGTYAGKTCEVSDMIICVKDGTTASNDDWTVVQNNIDGAVTGPASAVDARVAVFNGTTGKVIKDSGFTIAKSVPSNAVFTDTDTKVTSSANHYAPSTASGSDKSASASGATAAWGIDVVKGVTLNTDGKGHVTGISVTSGKIPTNPNTDTKVKATAKTDDVNYKILATASADPTSGGATEAVYDADITLNPSTNTIAANISGNAATATNATNATSANTASDYAAGGGIATALSGKAASSHAHGNITNGGAITATGVTIANGDALTIVDSSASGALVKSSITFDGSTATQALTKAGTWATFNNYSHPTTSGNKHIPSGGSSGQFLGWSADGTAKWVNNPNTDTVEPAKLGSGYGTCATAEATATKAATLSNYVLRTGGHVSVKFTYAVPASATLNINSAGAKDIYYRGAAITAGVIGAGDTATFVYDGTQYQLLSIDSGEQEMTTTEVDDLLAALT